MDKEGFNEYRYRMDDTINIQRKSNLSVDRSKSLNNIDIEFDFKEELEERYGIKLVPLLQNLFENWVQDGKYL